MNRPNQDSKQGSHRARSLLVSAVVCAVLAITPASASADAGETSKQAGLGIGSAFASLVYAPVKIVYAIGGCVVGGLAWAFSGGDSEVLKVVVTPSVLGDYVVTPAHLTGDEPLEFFGRDPEYTPDAIDVAASSPDQTYDDRAW